MTCSAGLPFLVTEAAFTIRPTRLPLSDRPSGESSRSSPTLTRVGSAAGAGVEAPGSVAPASCVAGGLDVVRDSPPHPVNMTRTTGSQRVAVRMRWREPTGCRRAKTAVIRALAIRAIQSCG